MSDIAESAEDAYHAKNGLGGVCWLQGWRLVAQLCFGKHFVSTTSSCTRRHTASTPQSPPSTPAGGVVLWGLHSLDCHNSHDTNLPFAT